MCIFPDQFFSLFSKHPIQKEKDNSYYNSKATSIKYRPRYEITSHLIRFNPKDPKYDGPIMLKSVYVNGEYHYRISFYYYKKLLRKLSKLRGIFKPDYATMPYRKLQVNVQCMVGPSSVRASHYDDDYESYISDGPVLPCHEHLVTLFYKGKELVDEMKFIRMN